MGKRLLCVPWPVLSGDPGPVPLRPEEELPASAAARGETQAQVTAISSVQGAPYVLLGDEEGTFSVLAINTLSVQISPTTYSLRADELVRMRRASSSLTPVYHGYARLLWSFAAHLRREMPMEPTC